MNTDKITAGAGAIVDTIRTATSKQGIPATEAFAMTAIAFVEMAGQARGPHGLVDFLRDLADQIEADNRRRVS